MRILVLFFFLILLIIVFIIPAITLLNYISQTSEQLSLKRSVDLLKITVNHLYDEGSCSTIILTIPKNKKIIGFKNNIFYGTDGSYANVSTILPVISETITQSGSYRVCLGSNGWTAIPINLVYDNGNYGIGPWGTRVNGWPDSTAGWIWNKKSTSRVPPGSVTFYKLFNIPKGTFTIYMTTDNSFKLFIDGNGIMNGNIWTHTYKTSYSLSAGTHTIKIIATNAGTSQNPAGVLFAMYNSNDDDLVLQSDGTWKFSI